MTPGPENFDTLRRLLKLKRYEQPRPGYFNDFSRQVLARIQAGEDAESTAASPVSDVSWLHTLWGWFEGRPALAGLAGAAVCVMLVVGVTYSERVKSEPVSLSSVALPAAQPVDNASEPLIGTLLPPDHVSLARVSSTNPAIATPPGGSLSLFDQIQNLPQFRAEPVSLLTPVQPHN